MNSDDLKNVVTAFNRQIASLTPIAGAFSSRVFLLNGQEILRGRTLSSTSFAQLEYESELLDSARPLTSVKLPQYVRTENGDPGVCAQDSLWTLHPLIEGEPAGTWTEIHTVAEPVSRSIIGTLRTLHDATRGSLPNKLFRPFFLLDMVRPLMKTLEPYLSPIALDRCVSAMQRIQGFSEHLQPSQAVFVHGDYHHGNVLIGAGDRIHGAIDLDDARYGHPFDDMGYTTAMMTRDFERFDPSFRIDKYRQTLEWYGAADLPWEFLPDYIALYALFDCNLFLNSASSNAAELFQFQCAFLHNACVLI